VAEETQKRKAEHIRICLDEKAQAKKATAGFEDITFIHRALPEVNKEEIDLSTKIFGHRFNAPIIVGAMTGGTPEAQKINANIAEAAERLGIGMGVGSQRAAIEAPELAKTYAEARKKAPNAFLIANIGGVQLVHGYSLKEAKKAVEMIQADALAIHLNALQEAIQPEGQTNFAGILQKIKELANELHVPVIVKETGCGISAEDAKKLEESGVKAIDIGGVGGTSFAAVEYYRTGKTDDIQRALGEEFWDWGIPTVVSLAEVARTVKIPIFASGGLRDGIDIAKSLALGASLTSISQPVLQAAIKGAAETMDLLSLLTEELRNVMFLVGAQKTDQLKKVPLVIGGETARWLSLRGFSVEGYARRGQDGNWA
jgi:isopentenyl-diphosphate delta-isomerase